MQEIKHELKRDTEELHQELKRDMGELRQQILQGFKSTLSTGTLVEYKRSEKRETDISFWLSEERTLFQ